MNLVVPIIVSMVALLFMGTVLYLGHYKKDDKGGCCGGADSGQCKCSAPREKDEASCSCH